MSTTQPLAGIEVLTPQGQGGGAVVKSPPSPLLASFLLSKGAVWGTIEIKEDVWGGGRGWGMGGGRAFVCWQEHELRQKQS